MVLLEHHSIRVMSKYLATCRLRLENSGMKVCSQHVSKTVAGSPDGSSRYPGHVLVWRS